MELLHLAPETKHFHCPYNASHTMPQKTLMKHLVKCPDKPPNFRSCIYNLSHVMPESDIKDHEENCQNRILFDTAVYESEDINRPVIEIDSQPLPVECEESWDNLEKTDTLKNINKKTVLMKAKHGNTPSERKKYRTTLHEHDMTNPKQDGNKSKIQNQKPKDETKQQYFIGKKPSVGK